MKKIIYLGLVTIALSGCGSVSVHSPIYGYLYTNVKSPVTATSNANSTKVGTATAKGILGVAKGDASIEAAAKSAGITKIHHVDQESKSILGLFGKYKVIVYGE